MVSSELVVLLIVCVGINTGSAQQEYCQGDTFDDSICNYIPDINTLSCVNTTLWCVERKCYAYINSLQHTCPFHKNDFTRPQPILCCFCNITRITIFGKEPPWWDCEILRNSSVTIPIPHIITTSVSTAIATIIMTTKPKIPMTTRPNIMKTSHTDGPTVSQSSTMVTMPTVNMTTNSINIGAVVAPVVVVLVVCLLVVCAIATIIIQYQRAKQASLHYQPGTEYKTVFELSSTAAQPHTAVPTPPAPYNGHHTNNTQQPSCGAYMYCDEEENFAGYSRPVTDKTIGQYCLLGDSCDYSKQSTERPTGEYSLPAKGRTPGDYSLPAKGRTPGDYRTMTEEAIQSPGTATGKGKVYSAVVVKDGKKTTVKTTVQKLLDDSAMTLGTIDMIEDMGYAAVIKQDGKKTCVQDSHH